MTDLITDAAAFLRQQGEEHAVVLQRTLDSLGDAFARTVHLCQTALNRGGKIVFFGNGGSAADAQHLAAELVVRYRQERPAMAAIALTTDSSILTACANDYSYDHVFARQVEALVRPEDAVIGISTSGNSPNVLAGLEAARRLGAATIGFAGRDGGKMPSLCDALLVVPSPVTARIQEMHIMIGHALCDLLEQAAVDAKSA